MNDTLPMSHKRKRSCESLPEIFISNGHPTKIPTVDLSTFLQDSGSSNPLTLLPWPLPISESPPSSESSQASSQRFPLTKRNLHQFNRINRTMASNPNTPDNKSRKTKTTTTSTSESVRSVLIALAKNNIYIDDTAAETRAADLIETARAIVKGERKSALKKEQGLALRDTAKEYATSNEMTFLVNVWTKFLGDEDTRLVNMTADGVIEDEEGAIRWIETGWKKDHLRCNWNADFTRGSIPELKNLDPFLKLHTEKVPRVKNPKPDLTYGLLQAAFSKVEQDMNDEHKAGLSVGMVHPFFVVEAKIGENPIEVAQLQCARGGAAMVRLKRKFDQLAEGTYIEEATKQGQNKDGQSSPNKEETPIDHYRTDTKSFAFSLALVPQFATMFVHWVEEAFSKEGTLLTINWHASQVAQYILRDGAHWIELHRDIDNVLDWGVLTRRQEMEGLCNKILVRKESNKKQKT